MNRPHLDGKVIAQRRDRRSRPPKELSMGSIRTRTVGVGAFMLLTTGLFALPALAQQGGQHSPREGVANSKAGDQTMPLNNLATGDRSRPAAGTTVLDADAGAPAPSTPGASAPIPAPGGGGGGGGASSGPAPAPAPPAAAPVGAAPSTTPLGLSQDAPDVPPSLGGGKGGSSPGSSPAATPEPSTLLLMGTGLVGLYRLRKRQ